MASRLESKLLGGASGGSSSVEQHLKSFTSTYDFSILDVARNDLDSALAVIAEGTQPHSTLAFSSLCCSFILHVKLQTRPGFC